MMEFEDIRDEVELLYVKSLRRHLVSQGLLPRSTFNLRDLGIIARRDVYSGYDQGATECEIQRRIDQVASESGEDRLHWKERLAWGYLRKLSRKMYVGWLELRSKIGVPNDCPKIWPWNIEDINVIMRMINPMGLIPLQQGLYHINNPIEVAERVRVSVEGYGYGTILRTDNPETDVFLVKSDHSLIRNAIITCKDGLTKTKGAGVNVDFLDKGETSYPMKSVVRDLWIDKQYYPLRYQGKDGTGDITIDTVWAYYPRYIGASFELGSASGEVYAHKLLMVTPKGAQPYAGVRIRGGGGWWFTDVDIIRCGRSFVIDPVPFAAVDWGFYKGLTLDSGDNQGMWLCADAEGAKIRGHSFSVCWSSSHDENGNMIDAGVGTIEAISHIGSKFLSNKGGGIYIKKPKIGGVLKDIGFYLCKSLNNSMAGSGLAHGLYAEADVSDFEVFGGQYGNLASLPSNQGWGIRVEDGAGDRYEIKFADVRDNVWGGIYDGGTGLFKRVKYNKGYRTEMKSIAVIPAGLTSVTVGHALVKTPDVVWHTPRANLGAAWCSARDASNITLNVQNAPAGDTITDWGAEVVAGFGA